MPDPSVMSSRKSLAMCEFSPFAVSLETWSWNRLTCSIAVCKRLSE